jgi:DNA-directed RNA polymerase subunit beta'
MEDGITVRHQTDELTGLTNIEIMDPKDRPAAGKDCAPAYDWWMPRAIQC